MNEIVFALTRRSNAFFHRATRRPDAARPDAGALWDLRDPLGVDVPQAAAAAPAAAPSSDAHSGELVTPWRTKPKRPCAAVTVVEFNKARAPLT